MTDLTADKIAEYKPVEAGLATLREKYGSIVWDVSTGKGLDAARAARAAIREPRYEVERIRKALKAPAIAYGKRIDDEAKRITAALLEIEGPIDSVILEAEAQKERERTEREAKEQARIEAIHARIADIRALANIRVGVSADAIDKTWSELTDRELVETDFAEFFEQAKRAQGETIQALHLAYEDAHTREQESARLAAEREELAKLRREQEERDRAAAQERAKEEAAAKVARDAEEARQRAERQAHEAEMQKQRDAMKAQQAEIERQQREVREAQEKAQREAQEAAAAEQRRLQAIADAEAKKAREEAAEQAKRDADAADVVAQREREKTRPTDAAIVAVIANHYRISESAAFGWLGTFAQEKAA